MAGSRSDSKTTPSLQRPSSGLPVRYNPQLGGFTVKNNALLGAVVGCLFAVATVTAQENIRVHFEVYKNGKQVATPAVAVKNSEIGSLNLGTMGNAKVSFSPSRIDAQKIGVAFEIVTGGKTLKPHVVLVKQESGWVSWKSGSDSFDVRLFVVAREVAAARPWP
jgi:hypothetical protein